MSVKFKFNKSSSQVLKSLRDDLHDMLDQARKEIAEFLYKEIKITAPDDTGTYEKSWVEPEKTDKGYKIVNKLPASYMANGVYHSAGEPIVDPYNIFILEGFEKGAPIEFLLTQNQWEYRNIAAGKLQDVNILLWKFNQGALGLNPYTLLNTLFSKKVRRNI